MEMHLCVIGNRGRWSEWLGQIFDRKPLIAFLPTRSENMPKIRISPCQILSPIKEIMISEHRSEGRFS